MLAAAQRLWSTELALDSLRARVAAASVVVVVTAAAFATLGHRTDPSRAYVLRTSLDDAVPFLPWTVWLYSWVYTSMLYPLFVVRSGRLFARVLAAYVLVVVVSLATYALFPVTSAGFRPDPAQVDAGTVAGWATRLTYFVDAPTNLFPSLHMSIACLATLSAWKARRRWGLAAVPVTLAIAVSILTMKQHYFVDGLAGAALALGAYAWLVRPYPRERIGSPKRAFGWPGPVLYLAFHAAFYALFLGLWAGGWTPWQ